MSEYSITSKSIEFKITSVLSLQKVKVQKYCQCLLCRKNIPCDCFVVVFHCFIVRDALMCKLHSNITTYFIYVSIAFLCCLFFWLLYLLFKKKLAIAAFSYRRHEKSADYVAHYLMQLLFKLCHASKSQTSLLWRKEGRNGSQEALMCTRTPTSITNSGLKPCS